MPSFIASLSDLLEPIRRFIVDDDSRLGAPLRRLAGRVIGVVRR